MPATVVRVQVKPGDRVDAGATLLVLEAMKMEHTITAPASGRVKHVRYAVGEQVAQGVELVDFEPAPAASAAADAQVSTP